VALGFGAFLILVTLAVTSTNGWIRRLGGRRWNRLHRLVYVAAVAASAHYFLAVKRDVRSPLAFAAVLAVLLGVRVVLRARSAPARRPVGSVSPELPQTGPGQ
jgi:sulfoxide reductase heme-binding subunit YedZ